MAMHGNVTILLRKWQTGDQRAADLLMPLVYDQLRVLASSYMRSERSGHTLRPTAVVHEAYMKLADTESVYADRLHFFAVAAKAMRQILLDWARGRNRVKRGDGAKQVELQDNMVIAPESPEQILQVNELLERLSGFDERKARVVELIFFGGMTYEETAEFLGVTPVTVHRDLKLAKAWMRSEAERASPQDGR